MNLNLIHLVLIFFKRDIEDLKLCLLLASSNSDNGEGSSHNNNTNNSTSQNQISSADQNQNNPTADQNQNNPTADQNQNNVAAPQNEDDSCDGYETDDERLGIPSTARPAEDYDDLDLERLYEDELRKAAQATADRCRNIRQRWITAWDAGPMVESWRQRHQEVRDEIARRKATGRITNTPDDNDYNINGAVTDPDILDASSSDEGSLTGDVKGKGKEIETRESRDVKGKGKETVETGLPSSERPLATGPPGSGPYGEGSSRSGPPGSGPYGEGPSGSRPTESANVGNVSPQTSDRPSRSFWDTILGRNTDAVDVNTSNPSGSRNTNPEHANSSSPSAAAEASDSVNPNASLEDSSSKKRKFEDDKGESSTQPSKRRFEEEKGESSTQASKRKFEEEQGESSTQPSKKFKQDSSDITSDTEPFDIGGGDD